MSRTVHVLLDIVDSDKARLLKTREIYACIYNQYAQWFVDNKTTNTTKAHHQLYQKQRQQFPDFPSGLIQSARNKAAANLKAWNSNNTKKKYTKVLEYKAQSMQYSKTTATLNTLGTLKFSCGFGKRVISDIDIPQFFTDRYGNWSFQAAVIGINKNGEPFAQLTFVKEKTPVRTQGKIVGLDRGVYNIISTSDGVNHSSSHVRGIKRKYQYNRKSIQGKVAQGSRSAKRKLKKISNKEARFTKDINHVLSKQLAQDSSVGTYVLENLTNIRKKKTRSKKLNRMLGNWSFCQLEMFLTYKCELVGISVEKVDPRYTSQRCNQCGEVNKSNRKGSVYSCQLCNYTEHADINAAKNIRDKYITSLP